MQHTMTDTTITITCTFGELCNMDSLGLSVWATPMPQKRMAAQVYLSERPRFRDDFLLATVGDFCEAEGWDRLGWDDMTEDEREAADPETITIEVPRDKSHDQRLMQ